MKPAGSSAPLLMAGCVAAAAGLVSLLGDDPPVLERLATGEVQLSLQQASGLRQVEASADLQTWEPMATLSAAAQLHEDSAAPQAAQKFYRTRPADAGSLTGDHLPTDSGAATLHPVDHASFLLQWNGVTIYGDPVGGGVRYAGLPQADLILVTHSHSDHFHSSTLSAVRAAGGRIVAPQSVYNSLPQTLRDVTTVLANGQSTNQKGVEVLAVPAYNLTASYHPKGAGNGYVLTLGGKKIYISGDTENVPEIKALTGIDVALVAVNQPFTMTVEQAADLLRAMKPRVAYPYHFRNQGGSFSNLQQLRTLVGRDSGVEVRLRDWYL